MSQTKEELDSHLEDSPVTESVPLKKVEESSKIKKLSAQANASPAVTRKRGNNTNTSKVLITNALKTSKTINEVDASTTKQKKQITVKVKQTEVTKKTQENTEANDESEEIVPKEIVKVSKNSKIFHDMIDTAIKTLKTRKGVSLIKIKQYLAATYDVDTKKQGKKITKYINTCIDSGNIVNISGKGVTGSFTLSKEYIIELDEQEKKGKQKAKNLKVEKKLKSTKSTVVANPKRKSMSAISKRNLTPKKSIRQTAKKAISRSKSNDISDDANQVDNSEAKTSKVKKSKPEEPKGVKKPTKEKKKNTSQTSLQE